MRIESFLQREIKRFPNINFTKLTPYYIYYYLKWFKDPLVRRHLDADTPEDDAGIVDFVNWASRSDRSRYYIVTLADEPIGHAGLKNIDDKNLKAELSCMIGERKYIGSGIGIATMVNFANFILSNHPEIEEFELIRLDDLSKRLFEKTGFVKSGKKDRWSIYRIKKVQVSDFISKLII